MRIIQKTFIILFSTVVGFGLWYGIFWLITTQKDPMTWNLLQRSLYCLLSAFTMIGIGIELDSKD